MAKVTNFRVNGDAILNRLGQNKPKAADAVPVPASLLPALQNFAKVHDKYSEACAKADKGREKRDKALDAVGAAAGKLDAGIEALANALVGAGLGSRKNPFDGLSHYAPSALIRLSYADTQPAVSKLVAAVLEKGVPTEIAKLAGHLLTLTAELGAARVALDVPQTDFAAAMGKRDGMLPDWQKALNALKAHAKVAWLDEPATYKAVFAAVAR